MIKIIFIFATILFFIKIYESYYKNKKSLNNKKIFKPPEKSKIQDADFEDIE